MTACRELGKQRNITESTLLEIDKLHDNLKKLIDNFSKENFDEYENVKDLVKRTNRALQELWQFPIDDIYDPWTNHLEEKYFVETWAGRTFMDLDDGEIVTIEAKYVRPCGLIAIGHYSFVDLGRPGAYHRIVGNIKEITEEYEA
jgi:hypothetical protein